VWRKGGVGGGGVGVGALLSVSQEILVSVIS